jgi:hypothetical protein
MARLAAVSCSLWINGAKHTTTEAMTAITRDRRRGTMLLRKNIDREVRLRNVRIRSWLL